MTTTNIAEVLKLAAKPIQYDNDEKTWLEFRSNLPTGTEDPNAESHTVRLAGDTDHGTNLETGAKSADRNGFEAWRQMAAENAPKTAGRRFAMPQGVLQPGMSDNPAKFEERGSRGNIRWTSTKICPQQSWTMT